MKRMALGLLLVVGVGLVLGAQEEEGRFVNELSVTGELKVYSQLNLDGTSYISVDWQELIFTYRLTKYSGLVYNLGLAKDFMNFQGGAYGSGAKRIEPLVRVHEFWGYTDLLGEAGLDKYVGLGLRVGAYKEWSEYTAAWHVWSLGFERGGLQTDAMDDEVNIRWDIPIHALAEIFPLNIWVHHDADFSRSNNDVSVGVHLEGMGLSLLDEQISIHWNTYYNYRGAAVVNRELNLALEQHSVGGSYGMSYMLQDNMRLGLGLTGDYRMYTHAKSYEGQRLDWRARNLKESANQLGVEHLHQLGYEVAVRYSWDEVLKITLGHLGQHRTNSVKNSDNLWAKSVFWWRFELHTIKWLEVYGGMLVDLRPEETIAQAFNRPLYGYERLSVDFGVVYTGAPYLRIFLGYFWGNMHNGSLEATRYHGAKERSVGARETGKIANHIYLQTKFSFY